MSLNNLNTLTAASDDPIVLWKSKHRVHYRDEVEELRNQPICTERDQQSTSEKPKAISLNKLVVPEEHEEQPLLDHLPSSSQTLTVRQTPRITTSCDQCGQQSTVVMSHPISPLAKSQNNLELVETVNARQALVPAHPTRMHRDDSAYSLAALQTLQISRRPSLLLQDILMSRPSVLFGNTARRTATPNGYSPSKQQTKNVGSLNGTASGSMVTINTHPGHGDSFYDSGSKSFHAKQFKEKNRRQGNDAISAALSATYCKLLVLLGVCLPITEVISEQIPTYIYQGFYVYLYVGSIAFVAFLYISAYRSRTLFNALKDFHERENNVHLKHKVQHFGSFYLRVGAIAFAIGTMVYSGLEFGQYFELNGQPGCRDVFIAITPICRMVLCIVQVQFIFLNTTYLDMARHKVTSRFGLMHMVATNLCEWLYVLVDETKHEIFHIQQHEQEAEQHHPGIIEQPASPFNVNWTAVNASFGSNTTNTSVISTAAEQIISNLANTFATNASAASSAEHHDSISAEEFSPLGHHLSGCSRTNIMGALVQEVSPFLFPCTIEYSLICAVILYEMWKTVKSIPDIDKTRKHSMKPAIQKPAHHFSVDCSQSHKGLFFGILVIVMTIISMIMYFVLFVQPGYKLIATQEVTLWETVMYVLCTVAIVAGMFFMRDLRYVQSASDDHHSMELDNLLLVVAQTGVYLYSMFTIFGSYFSPWDTVPDRVEGIVAEVFDLMETALQTMFILHASHRRCKGAKQARRKPGREIITFLLVANIAIWFLNTLIKGRAVFRATHLVFYGVWGWTIITHIAMPLAIFYRFHSTICLFEVWKVTYKAKAH